MKDYIERKDELLELAEVAKKRYVFYYEHYSGIDEIQRVEALKRINEIFSNISFGFDYNEQGHYTAYCDSNNNINVNKSFWVISKEEQVAVLVHEINHAVSRNNQYNYLVEVFCENANYIDSYKIIEEGLADINAELIMYYYYENSDCEIENGEKVNFLYKNTCGYPIDRKILKTLLIFMQIMGIDKNMLYIYYFGNKSVFFDMIVSIGGKNAFEMIMEDKSYGFDIKNQVIANEYFRSLEKKFIEEMQKKDFSSGIYSGTKFNNVYLKGNDLCSALRTSYFVSEMLSNFDIKNIDKNMIDEIYNKTNGLIPQVSLHSSGYVSQVVDDLICFWVDNCSSFEEFKYITKLVPNVFSLDNYKYLLLSCKKKLNIDLTSIKIENINDVIEILNQAFDCGMSKEKTDNFDDEICGQIIFDSNNKILFSIVQQVYNLSNKEQLDNFFLYRSLCNFEKALLVVKKIFGDEINLTYEKLIEILNDESLVKSIGNLNLEIKREMIKTYIDNCTYDNIYLIENIFPDAFTMNDGEFLEYAHFLCKISDTDLSSRKK